MIKNIYHYNSNSVYSADLSIYSPNLERYYFYFYPSTYIHIFIITLVRLCIPQSRLFCDPNSLYAVIVSSSRVLPIGPSPAKANTNIPSIYSLIHSFFFRLSSQSFKHYVETCFTLLLLSSSYFNF